ncbi:MAG: nuclear transport factor 2 family protein [Pseudomonadota bacterium]
MASSIETFFDAWALDSRDERLQKISASVDASATYVDPRTPEPITGIDALTDYVGMFSANAPGWSAKVVKADTNAGTVRATVAFSGPGPDGTTQTQLGQYFVELKDDLVTRMVGFVGTGQPAD